MVINMFLNNLFQFSVAFNKVHLRELCLYQNSLIKSKVLKCGFICLLDFLKFNA